MLSYILCKGATPEELSDAVSALLDKGYVLFRGPETGSWFGAPIYLQAVYFPKYTIIPVDTEHSVDTVQGEDA